MALVRWIAAAFSSARWAVADFMCLLYGTSTPTAVTRPVAPKAPEEFVGATDAWADRLRATRLNLSHTRTQELARVDRQLWYLEPTAEYPIVLVSIDKLPLILRAAARPTVSLVRTTPRLRRDALGTWDPSTVDWSAPALYEETALDLMGSFGRIVRPDDRYTIAGSLADRVLCGVVPSEV